MRLQALAALILALLLAACGGQPDVIYKDGYVRAKGWSGPEPSQGWPSVLAVYAGGPGAPPMLGDYRRRGSTLRFEPRFKPAAGIVVRVVYRPPGQEPIQRAFLQGGGRAVPSPMVIAISPQSDVLPANLLKLYVEFSEPMARGEAYQHLAILDAKGKLVANPFVEIDQELWDPAGRRLTVLFDPGRIKRGVKPNQDIGAPLVPGRSYRLVVAKGWLSAAGAPMANDTVKAFAVGASERSPIALNAWRITPPKAGSRDPLVVDFPRPLDTALVADSLHPARDGEGLAGTVKVGNESRRWSFTPREPWVAGPHALVVDTRLEDLAGNRIGRAFDVDTVADPQARITATSESLSFSVR